jgi:hypothetical protein
VKRGGISGKVVPLSRLIVVIKQICIAFSFPKEKEKSKGKKQKGTKMDDRQDLPSCPER